MRLTPLDIKKQEFSRSFRGVDEEEVNDFLHELASQWDSLLDENRRLEQKVREYDSKLDHYRKIEEALQEALETARDNSHKTIENAQREAQIILKEARSAAEEIRKKSVQDHKRLKHDISKIGGRRDEIVARLRAFLMSEMELLARFEGQDPVSFLRMERADHRQLNPSRYEDPGREINLNASYASSIDDPFEEAPVDLPMDEEEVSFEEERHDPVRATRNGAFNLSLTEEPDADDTADGLSSDELEFIRSTVTSATPNAIEDDIFKPAKSEVSQDWNHRANTPPRNGQHVDRSRRPVDDNPEGSAGGWIVRPAVRQPSQQEPPPPRANQGFSSPLFTPDQDNDDLSATPEEIEKIRRILNDLD